VTRLLDTSICIAFLNRADANVVARLHALGPDQLRLCSVVRAELLYGAHRSARVAENLTRLADFFASLESLPFDDAAAQHYGPVRASLAARGTPIGGNDLMIASIALAASAIVVTRDAAEFRRVPALPVEVW
jgi:tRNA(fMet)-specific endonuclease VapC